MTEELDKVLHEEDRKLAVDQFFQERLGSEPGKAKLAARALADNFTLTGATLMFGDKLAKDAVDDVIAHLKRQGYDFLLPPEKANATPKVDDAEVRTAFNGAGNVTAAARIIKQIGREEADKLAQQYGKAHALDNKPGVAPQGAEQKNGTGSPDHKNNPWGPHPFWNVTRQGQIVRALGAEKAAQMAAAVNSHIGATKPSM
jgi:hypothetical protein